MISSFVVISCTSMWTYFQCNVSFS